MGTVYLGRRPATAGRWPSRSSNPSSRTRSEFRARFRSEVNRARQVPPFCTAEVLDADPDHETPYLVVEYVDGPSLAEVVAEQGPLTGGSLHSVAVGVATALAAIHGAGVIHRDLKPANVLFALGTPKVIDFGIARAFEATSQHTGTDQMVGTVAYMAPERFDTDSSRDRARPPTCSPGAPSSRTRAPAAPRSAATAPRRPPARILTQPPKLDGLPAPLRDLVARTLAKDPARAAHRASSCSTSWSPRARRPPPPSRAGPSCSRRPRPRNKPGDGPRGCTRPVGVGARATAPGCRRVGGGGWRPRWRSPRSPPSPPAP